MSFEAMIRRVVRLTYMTDAALEEYSLVGNADRAEMLRQYLRFLLVDFRRALSQGNLDKGRAAMRDIFALLENVKGAVNAERSKGK